MPATSCRSVTGRYPLPDHNQDPFGQWVDHINNGTRADDNLNRAVELTRLVVAANQAAEEGRTIPYAGL